MKHSDMADAAFNCVGFERGREVVVFGGGRSVGKSTFLQNAFEEYCRKDAELTENFKSSYIEENSMKKTVTFKYMNGKPYTVRDVVEITNPENLWKASGWVQLLEFTQMPDKWTRILKTIPLNDVVGIIVKEGSRTTIYENPAFNTVVDADVETVRSRIRKGNRKMKQQQQETSEDPQDNMSWESVKSFAE